MFPFFNCNFGLSNRFPNPKPIHSARPNVHRIVEDEPVMSGNDIAAAAVALAASCVIMFLACRKGKSDKIIRSISGAAPTTPPPAPASALGGALPPGGGGVGGGAAAAAISHEHTAPVVSSHSASPSVLPVGEEAVPARTSGLERPASDATADIVVETADRAPIVDITLAEPPISGLDSRPPLPADERAEIGRGLRAGKVYVFKDGDFVLKTPDEPTSLAAELRDFMDRGIMPPKVTADVKGTADAASAADAAASAAVPKATDTASSVDKGVAPLASDKTPTPPKGGGGAPPSSAPPATGAASGGSAPPAPPATGAASGGSAPPAPPASGAASGGSAPPAPVLPTPQAPPAAPISQARPAAAPATVGIPLAAPPRSPVAPANARVVFFNTNVGTASVFPVGRPYQRPAASMPIPVLPGQRKAAPVPIPPDSVHTPPASRQATPVPPQAASSSAPPPVAISTVATPPPVAISTVATPPPVVISTGATPQPVAISTVATPPPAASMANATRVSNSVPDAMLQKAFIQPDGTFQSEPVKDAVDQVIGCSKLLYTKEGRIKTSSFYGTDKKLQDSVEIVYNEYGQIEKFVFSDGTEKYSAAFDDNILKILGDDPKYSLLVKGLEREVTIEAEQSLSKGANAFEAGDYESAVKSWRPLTKIRNVAIPDNLYEAEFQVGATACRKATELTNAGEHIAADEKRAEAFEAWKALEKIENKGSYHNYKGLCHEVMGNHEKAVEAFANGAEERDVKAMINLARHCETGQGLPNGKNLDMAVELYQGADATAEAERVTRTIDDIKVANEALANLEPLPAKDLVDSSKPPSLSQGFAKAFGLTPPVEPVVVKPIQLPPELEGANADAVAKALFGEPRPFDAKKYAADLEAMLREKKQQGDAVFQEAMQLFVDKGRPAAKEKFATAIGIYKPLLEHDKDGTSFNAVGECFYGMGEYLKAIDYFERALNKGCKKANENIGICLATGDGFGGKNDLAVAIEMYRRGEAKVQLEMLLEKTDLAQEFRLQAQAALDELNAASQPIDVTELGYNAIGSQPAFVN